MQDKGQKAKELFLEGYNCCQAVVGAFAEELGLDFDTAMKLSSSFGGGFGRLREVCGAVSGMGIVAGLKCGYSDPTAGTEKKEHYARIQALADQYRSENGSIICRELLNGPDNSPNPTKRTPEFYKKRPCPELVQYAAELLEKELGDDTK